MEWPRYVACMGQKTSSHKVFVEKPAEKRHYEDLDTDGRILYWTLKK
jgi:hypothetical protein